MKRKFGLFLLCYMVLPIALLLAMEAMVRLWAPDRLRMGYSDRELIDFRGRRFPYVNRAGFVGIVRGRTAHINGQHLRNAADEPRESTRLLLLGDSVIFGIGLEDEEAPGVVLGTHLADSVAVLNSGTIGYTTKHQRAFLEEFGDMLRPRAVLLAYCINDPYPSDLPSLNIQPAKSDAQAERARSVAFNWHRTWLRNFLTKNSYLYQWLRGTLRPFLVRHGYEMVNYSHYGSLFNGRLWQQNRASLLQIQSWANQRNIPFGIAVFPHRDQLDETIETDEKPQQLLQAFAEEADIPFLDLRTVLTTSDFLFGDPLHLNARGMRVSLAAMADFYERELAPSMAPTDI